MVDGEGHFERMHDTEQNEQAARDTVFNQAAVAMNMSVLRLHYKDLYSFERLIAKTVLACKAHPGVATLTLSPNFSIAC